MISSKTIKLLYKRYPEPPISQEVFDYSKLINRLNKHHSITVDESNLIVDTLDYDSPFHEIPLKNITGIEYIGDAVAIVLRNSILFFSVNSDNINVHINIERESILSSILNLFKK